MSDNKPHRPRATKSYWSSNTCMYAYECMYAYRTTNKLLHKPSPLLEYFISNPFSWSSTFAGARFTHTIETQSAGWLLKNTDQRGMFNQPRSPCVAMHCCRRRLWERRATISHLYSLQMACVSRIMQIRAFFPPELKPRCHATRHTRPRHSKILFMALQSA